MSSETPKHIVKKLNPQLTRSEEDPRPIVLMTCGIAGSGKTTLSKTLLTSHPSFHRLSIDEIIFSNYGLCGINYPQSRYSEYSEEADKISTTEFKNLMGEGKDVILDQSFYSRKDREEFKSLIEEAGGRWVMVYFDVQPEILWRRICLRREKGVEANSALHISKELFKKYVENFEPPTPSESPITITF